MKHKNPHAVALGELAKGSKKTYTKQEIALRTKRVIDARKAFLQRKKNKVK